MKTTINFFGKRLKISVEIKKKHHRKKYFKGKIKTPPFPIGGDLGTLGPED